MSREQFVTGNLHRISGKIAEAAKKNEAEIPPAGEISSTGPESSGKPADLPLEKGTVQNAVSVNPDGKNEEKRKKLFAEMEESLRKHHEEALRFRQDLLFRTERLASNSGTFISAYEKKLDQVRDLMKKTDEIRSSIGSMPEPDPLDPMYQTRLAEFRRGLDRARLDLISADSVFQEIKEETAQNSASVNFFAEMASLKKRQLFRVGMLIFLPLGIVILLSAVIVSCFLLITFRAGV